MTPRLLSDEIQSWANRLTRYLDSIRSLLQFKTADAKAGQDGVILWDNDNGYPVVSKNGAFRQIVLSNGTLNAYNDTDITAAAINTAYGVTWSDYTAEGISVSGDTITIEEPGLYLISFSAQIKSTSSSTVNFRFWPNINGSDIPGSTIIASLHDNNATKVMSRSSLFTFAENDTIKAMWATDSLTGFLDAATATSYAPASPSVTISIVRIHQ